MNSLSREVLRPTTWTSRLLAGVSAHLLIVPVLLFGVMAVMSVYVSHQIDRVESKSVERISVRCPSASGCPLVHSWSNLSATTRCTLDDPNIQEEIRYMRDMGYLEKEADVKEVVCDPPRTYQTEVGPHTRRLVGFRIVSAHDGEASLTE